ncbi:MAG: hypothetical protein AAGH92_04515 [Planctomycetota bacterium]
MSLLWAMLMLLGTWLSTGLAVLCLGAGLWRLLGLERGDGAAVEPEPSATSENDALLPDRFRSAHPSPQTFVGPLDSLYRASLSFGMGLVAIVAILSAWHLVLPVNFLAVGFVLMLAALAGVVAMPELRAACLAAGRAGKPVLVAWAMLGVWLSNRAAAGADLSVTGLAWYPIVGWADAYPAVPGVGNVNPVYGWNAGGLLVAALLSEGPWVGRVGQAANGWLLWWVSLPALAACVKLLQSKTEKPRAYVDTQSPAKKTTIGDIYDAAWLAPVVVLAMGAAINDPLPGVGAGVLLWLAGGALLRMSGPDEPHRGRRIDGLIAATLCCFGAMAWDPMCVPPAMLLAGFAAWRLLKTERALVEGRRPTRSIGFDHEKLPGLQARAGAVVAVGLASACVLGLWAARNVVLTGMLAFPLTTTGALPVDWAVSPRDASLDGWLPRPAPLDAVIGAAAPMLLPALAGGALMLAWLGRGGAEGRWKQCAAAGLMLTLAGLAWFATGCGISGFGAAWGALAAGVALNARAVVQRGRPVKGPSGVALLGGFGVAAVVLAAGHVLTAGGAALWPMGRDAQAALALQADDDMDASGSVGVADLMPIRIPFVGDAGLAPRITPDLQPWRSRWGVEVAITASPISTDDDPQASDLTGPAGPLPWAAPQPSMTQAPSDDLRYRGGPDDLRAGFRIDRTDPGSFADPAGQMRSADRVRAVGGGS